MPAAGKKDIPHQLERTQPIETLLARYGLYTPEQTTASGGRSG